MDALTPSTTDDELDLDVSFVESGLEVAGVAEGGEIGPASDLVDRIDRLVGTRCGAGGRREREVQAGGAGRRGDAVLRADVRRDRLLELGDLRALGHPARFDRLVRRPGLFLAERRLRDRNVHLLARLNCHCSSRPLSAIR